MRFLAILAMFGVSILGFDAKAQSLPSAPDPVQNLAAEGAQVRYLGNEHGLDAWIAVKNGQEQYFYALPSGEAFVMGILFDREGDLVTVDQVQRLQAQLAAEGDQTLSALAEDLPSRSDPSLEFQSPSEQMYADVENSNWVALGNPNAPVIYSFIDPQCPHCHEFAKDLRGVIDAGEVQLRLIPIGLRPETIAQSAFLIAAPNGEERWNRHLEGDETALPVQEDINTQGAERNMAVMQSWNFNVTPMITYRANDGTVKIVRGRPGDVESIIRDLAG